MLRRCFMRSTRLTPDAERAGRVEAFMALCAELETEGDGWKAGCHVGTVGAVLMTESAISNSTSTSNDETLCLRRLWRLSGR